MLAIPFKKSAGRVIGYLSEPELRAILGAPDRSTAAGRRQARFFAEEGHMSLPFRMAGEILGQLVGP